MNKRNRSQHILPLLLALMLPHQFACSSAKLSDQVRTADGQPIEKDKNQGQDIKPAENPEISDLAKEDQETNPEPKKDEPAQDSTSELLAKTVWTPAVATVLDHKVLNSGFDGVNKFSVIFAIQAQSSLPKEVEATFTDEQKKKYLVSEALRKEAQAQQAKIILSIDPSFATIVPYKIGKLFRFMQLTTLKAGSTTIKMKLADKESEAILNIAPYTAAQVAAGKARFNTAVVGASSSPACISCHNSSSTGTSYSSRLISAYSDAVLLNHVTAGTDVFGRKLPIDHSWTFRSEAEKAGIIPYLRSIDPTTLALELDTVP